MRSVHRYGRLDDYADQCESIRLRINQQLDAVRAKHELWPSLAEDKVAALREIRDNLKEVATGVIRHGDRPSLFPGHEVRGLSHDLYGCSLKVSQEWGLYVAHCQPSTFVAGRLARK